MTSIRASPVWSRRHVSVLVKIAIQIAIMFQMVVDVAAFIVGIAVLLDAYYVPIHSTISVLKAGNQHSAREYMLFSQRKKA